MTDDNQHSGRKKSAQQTQHLSPDGVWRSFPKVPNLICYVKSGTYYGRCKVKGKIIRRSLHKEGEGEISFTIAKLRLADFIKAERTQPVYGTFADLRAKYEADLNASTRVNEKSRAYRKYCIGMILKTWPEIDALPLKKITEQACKEWASKLSQRIAPVYYNNTIGTFKLIIAKGELAKNPANGISRLGVTHTALHLPEPDQFKAILLTMETAGGGASKHCADYIRFLAYSGCRISEAAAVTWADVDFERGQVKVVNAKQWKSKNNIPFRYVPMIAEMKELLERLKAERNPQPADKVCLVYKCVDSLTRACKKVGAARITHHDLRHLFATRCIESGVDIPTVSRWLGHRDGGALAMRVYGHLRNVHSIAMAQLVRFDPAAPKQIGEMTSEKAA